MIQAAAGATGLACVQLALQRGAEVFGTASAPEKLRRLRALGVQHPINYRTSNDREVIDKITGGRGVDVIIDSLSGDAISRGLSILSPGGRFIEIGAAGVIQAPSIDPQALFAKNHSF